MSTFGWDWRCVCLHGALFSLPLYTYGNMRQQKKNMIRILNRAHMKLTIKNLQYGDFGNYRCISKNSLGETEGSIRVYGKRFNYPLACAQYLEMMIICSKTFSSNFASFSVQCFCCCIFFFTFS